MRKNTFLVFCNQVIHSRVQKRFIDQSTGKCNMDFAE